MEIREQQLQVALEELGRLSQSEYGVHLESFLREGEQVSDVGLLRLGRLLGVAVKKPFATGSEASSPSVATGALRRWDLVPDLFDEREKQATWQFAVLARLIRDPVVAGSALGEVKQVAQEIAKQSQYRHEGKLASLFSSVFRLKTATASREARDFLSNRSKFDSVEAIAEALGEQLQGQLVRNAASEMINERGFFRSMAISLDNRLRSSRTLFEGLSMLQSGNVRRFSSDTNSARQATLLALEVEWLGVADPLLPTGFAILVNSRGVKGFAEWVESGLRQLPDET
jgi:hypothetical protein